ncbi:MAG: LPXTG cell wall anchor domain-containing protein [Ilumatobacteraceae bacterium]
MPPATPQLPTTGSESGRIAILGLAALGLGLTLLGLRRRSRPVNS